LSEPFYKMVIHRRTWICATFGMNQVGAGAKGGKSQTMVMELQNAWRSVCSARSAVSYSGFDCSALRHGVFPCCAIVAFGSQA
jgi:hypothetical protein